ncbi:MAG: hypothetical protein ACLRWP_07720 [Bilophila wadsworthia]
MQEEITRLVQGLDDSALRFIEACVRHERETRNAPQVPPPSMPHPGGQFTVPENVRHLTSEQLDAVSKAFLDWYKASVSTTQGRSRGRLWLVFLLIRYGALRLGEVLSIDDRTDLDFARSVVSVRGENQGTSISRSHHDGNPASAGVPSHVRPARRSAAPRSRLCAPHLL